jgi:hypothetical protein
MLSKGRVAMPSDALARVCGNLAARHRSWAKRAGIEDGQRCTTRRRDRASALPRSSGSPRTRGLASG